MTTKQKSTTGSPELQLEEKFSVEAYADNLIDDLFQDVEKVLEGGSRLPKESVKPEFLSLKPIKVPQIVLPRKMPSPEELAKQKEEEAKAAALAEAKSKEESQSLDRILLGAAFASLVISLSLLLATKGGIEGVVKYFTTSTTPEVETPDPKAEADGKFADYIERSLDSLDKNPNTTGNNSPAPAPAVPVPPPPSELPTVPVEGSPAQNMSNLLLPLNRIADLIEAQAARPPATIPPAQVVIIPPSPQPVPVVVTYNPPPAPAPAPVAKAEPEAKPAPAPVAKAEPEAKPAPAPVAKAEPEAKPAPAPVAKAEPEAAPAPVAKEEPAPAPAPVAKAEPAPAPAPAAKAEPEAEVEQKVEQVAGQPQLDPLPPPPAVMTSESVALRTIPNYTHTLVGVLELGDRSAALFEINGVARRIYVGESIGASGWMLVKVVEGEATMRRNGEIRSVFVGEQF